MIKVNVNLTRNSIKFEMPLIESETQMFNEGAKKMREKMNRGREKTRSRERSSKKSFIISSKTVKRAYSIQK